MAVIVISVARWQNLIPKVEGAEAQSKERKGYIFLALHRGVIVHKPEGPNTYDLKMWQ